MLHRKISWSFPQCHFLPTFLGVHITAYEAYNVYRRGQSGKSRKELHFKFNWWAQTAGKNHQSTKGILPKSCAPFRWVKAFYIYFKYDDTQNGQHNTEDKDKTVYLTKVTSRIAFWMAYLYSKFKHTERRIQSQHDKIYSTIYYAFDFFNFFNFFNFLCPPSHFVDLQFHLGCLKIWSSLKSQWAQYDFS